MNPSPPEPEWITLGECERRHILPMRRTRLWQLASAGKLPGACRIGARFYINVAALRAAAGGLR